MPYTLQQFGQIVKEKYPTMKDMNDEDVARKILSIYPQYKSRVEGFAEADTPDINKFSSKESAKKAFVTDPVGSSLTFAQIIANPSKIPGQALENLKKGIGIWINPIRGFAVGTAAEASRIAGKTFEATEKISPVRLFSETTGIGKGQVPKVGEQISEAAEKAAQFIEKAAPEGTETSQMLGKTAAGIAAIAIPSQRITSLVKGIPAIANVVTKMPRLSKLLGLAPVSVGTTELAAIEQKGELANLKELGWGLALDATLGLGGSLVKGLLGSKITKSLKEQAKSAGISPGNIEAVSGLDDETKKIALELHDKAKKLVEDNIAMTPSEVASKYVDGFQKEVTDKLSDVGKKIGESKKVLSKEANIDVEPLYKSFREFVENKGVSIAKDNTLNFTDSTFEGLGSDQKLLNNVWDFLQPSKTKKLVSAFNLKNKIENINSILYLGASQADLTVSEAGAELVRRGLRGTLDKVGGDIGKYMRQYSDLSEIAILLTKKIKVEGMKSPQLLSSFFGAARKETRFLLDTISTVAEQFGFKNGKNLLTVANLAKTIEDAFKIIPERGLAGGVKIGAEAVIKPKASAVKIFDQWLGGWLERLQKSQPELIEQIIRGEDIDTSILERYMPDITKQILKSARAYLQTEESPIVEKSKETLSATEEAVNPFD